jgi:hypothetical protein
VRSARLFPILVLVAVLTVLAVARPIAATATTVAVKKAATAATTGMPEDGEDGTPWIYIVATALGVGAVAVGAWGISSVVVKNKTKEK